MPDVTRDLSAILSAEPGPEQKTSSGSDVRVNLKEVLYEQLSFGWLVYMLAIPLCLYVSVYAGEYLSPGFFLSYLLVFFLIGLILKVVGHSEAQWYLMVAAVVAIGVIFRDLSTFGNCLISLGFFAVMWFLSRMKKTHRIIVIFVLFVLLTILFLLRKDAGVWTVVCLLGLVLRLVQELTVSEQKFGLIPILVLQVLLIFTPVKEEPLRWTFFINLAHSLEERAEGVYRDVSYLFDGFEGGSFTLTGYSETAGLGGSTHQKPRDDLYLDSYARVNYLRGRSFDTLTPKGAENVCSDPFYNAYLVRLLNGLYEHGVSEETAECFIRNQRAVVTYHYLRTRDLLIDPYTFRLEGASEHGLEKLSGKGTSVTFHYLEFDYASPYFLEILRDGKGADYDYDTIREYGIEVLRLDLSQYMTEEEYLTALLYDPKSESAYLDTSMATDRIRSMTAEITEGCENDFDKAKAIEKFLRSYEYNPGVNLTGSENYIDDFLFETQSGYCVHFASAMTLMLRICNIPSRYCTGYMHRNSENKAVLSTEAHSWPQAYIEGVGWVPFEPTSAYGNAEQRSWGKRVKDPNQAEVIETEPETEPEIIQKPEKSPSDYRDPEAENRKEEKETVDWEMIRLFSTYLILLLLVVVLILVLYRVLKMVYYRRLSPEDRLKADVLVIRKRLEREREEETPVESFEEYLALVHEEDLKNRLKEIFSSYYRMRFRGDSVEEAYVSGVHSFAAELSRKKNL